MTSRRLRFIASRIPATHPPRGGVGGLAVLASRNWFNLQCHFIVKLLLSACIPGDRRRMRKQVIHTCVAFRSCFLAEAMGICCPGSQSGWTSLFVHNFSKFVHLHIASKTRRTKTRIGSGALCAGFLFSEPVVLWVDCVGNWCVVLIVCLQNR